MPTSSNRPSDLFSRATSRSPWRTWISTTDWLSATVVKTFVFFVGIVELRSISFSKTPPCVSMPRESGVTSSSTTSLISPLSTPPWIAAPIATTSSGLISRLGSRPKSSATIRWTFGVRVWPPTRMTWSTSEGFRFGRLQGVEAGRRRAVDQVRHERLEAVARQRPVDVLGTRGVGRDERQRDRRLDGRRELALGLLGGLLQALERHAVLPEVDAGRLLEVVEEPVHDLLVEVFAAEVGVAGRRLDLVDPVAQLQDRDIERAAAEVVDRDDLAALALEAVRERGGRRLVDDAQDLEARDAAGVARGLPLGVVEVRGDRDDRLGDLLAERLLGKLLDLLQDEGRYLLGAVLAAAGADLHVAVDGADDLVRQDLAGVLRFLRVELAADEPLDREDRVHRVGDRLALGDLADQPLVVLREADDRGGRAAPLPVGEHLRRGALDDRDAAVRRAQIDAEDLAQAASVATPPRPSGRALRFRGRRP